MWLCIHNLFHVIFYSQACLNCQILFNNFQDHCEIWIIFQTWKWLSMLN